ncbi:PQQ-binding-like beta-propeller repeat protein [bacterium]|nr:PQQ-binding-like beta-propeller repeat protein [bacterium]
MRGRLLVLLMSLLCLWGSAVFGQEWYVRVNSDDINGIAGEYESLWAVTNGGGTLLWDMAGDELCKFLKTQPDLYSDENWSSDDVLVLLRDELLTNSFTSVAIADDAVWLGCNQGINVIDTSEPAPADFAFWPAMNSANSALPSDLVTTIVVDPNSDEVWIGTQDGGIAIYDMGVGDWTGSYDSSNGLNSDCVNTIYFDTHNRVFIGTDAGVSCLNRIFDSWRHYNMANSGLPSDFVTGAAERLTCGEVWFTTDNGAACVDISDNWQTFGTWTDVNILSNDMRGILMHDTGGVSTFFWIWTEQGITAFDFTTWGSATFENTSGGLLSNDVRGVINDGNSRLVGTHEGLCRYDGSWHSTFENRLADNDLRAIANSDTEVWIGTYGSGANSLEWDANAGNSGIWSTYTYAPDDAIASNYINDVMTDDRSGNGAVWFATNLGVSFHEPGISFWQTLDTSNSAGGLPSDRVMAVELDPRPATGGVIRTWFGTDNGLACYATGSTLQWDTYTTSNSGLRSNYITSLAGQAIGGEFYLWIGTNWGIAVLDLENDTWVTYDKGNSDIVSENVRCLAVDANGCIWIGTTNGISKFDRAQNVWTTIRTSDFGSGLGSNTINSIIFGSSDTVWIATSRGLTKFTDGTMTGERFTTKNSGLINDNVYDLCYQPCIGLWLATRGGASVLRQGMPVLLDATLEPALSGPLTDYTFGVTYMDVDGFAPISAEVFVGRDEQSASPYDMELVSGSPDNGNYATTLALDSGHWVHYFVFADSDGCQVRYPQDTFTGPDTWDGFEPDNRCMDAALIWTDGSVHSGHNLVPLGTDEDWFYFRADTDIEYTITLNAAAGAAVEVEIYLDDCTLAPNPGGDSTAPFPFVAEVAGYYFLRVIDNASPGSSLESAGVYSISISGNQWPMLGRVGTRPATAASIGPREYQVAHTYTTGPTIASTPAIDGAGNLYFGADYGRLVSLSPDFEERWVYEPFDLDPVMCSPALSPDGSVVYYGTQEGYFYAVYSANGALYWRYPYPGPLSAGIYSSPVVDSDGNIYFASFDGGVYSLEPNGSLRWDRQVACPFLNSSPALSPDESELYIGCTEGRLYNIDTGNGSINNQGTVGYPIRTSPVVDSDGYVYVGADDGIMRSFAPNNFNTPISTFQTGGAIEGHGAFGGDDSFYFGSTDGIFYALNRDEGVLSLNWSFDTGGPICHAPAVDGAGHVYVGSESGSLFLMGEVQLPTGPGIDVLYAGDVGQPIVSSIVIGLDHEVFFVAGNTMYAIASENAEPDLVTDPVGNTGVIPAAGSTAETFRFFTTYQDIDYDFPAKCFIVLDDVSYHISDWQPGSDPYTFIFTLDTQFAEQGLHTYYFLFEDGYGGVARAPETGVYYGPMVDNTAPRSECSSPLSSNAPEIPVDYVSADDGSGVAWTTLYYDHCLDGDSWAPIAAAATVSSLAGETGTFMFSPPDGDGYYAFYTRATDCSGLIEDSPVYYYDSQTLYDTSPPTTLVLGAPPAFSSTPFIIDEFALTDFFSETFTIRFYYRFNQGEWQDSGIDTFGFDTETGLVTFSFDATYGQGQYDFFIVATDEMNNQQDYENAQNFMISVFYDVITPESAASCADYTRILPIVVNYTASDDATGVDTIRCYLKYKSDVSWTEITPDINIAPAARALSSSFAYNPNPAQWQSEGIYRFYTRARDVAGNWEPAPQDETDPDCAIVYDISDPNSVCIAADVFSQGDIPVSFLGSDNVAGLAEVRLFYSFNDGDYIRSTYVSDADAGVFQFTAANGDGVYRFYTIAVDNCGNIEVPPKTYDALSNCDTQPPDSSCRCSSTSRMIPIRVSYSATDAGSEVVETGLWAKHDDGEWVDTGMSLEGPSGTFEFYPMAVSGTYYFLTQSVDAVGHQEPFKDEADCSSEIIYAEPSSRGFCDPYTNVAPIVISYETSPFIYSMELAYTYEGGAWQDYITEATVLTGYLEFDPPEGEGYYEFLLHATDLGGNREGIKGVDCTTVYDTVMPESTCSAPDATWRHFVDVQFSASDDRSGPSSVELWYKYTDPDDSSRDIGWESSGHIETLTEGTFKFVFNHGLGIYDFYTRTTDNAGNVEPMLLTPKATTRYEIGAPSSRCWVNTSPISQHLTGDSDNPLEILFTASDANGNSSGLEEVRLFYAYRVFAPTPINDWTGDDIDWRYTGQALPADAGFFHFYPQDGNGEYAFYTQAIDSAGNEQERPLLKFNVPDGVPYWDAYITYDVIPPMSECSCDDWHVTDGLIAIDYVADDDPFLSESWPENDFDTSGVYRTYLWYRYEGGVWTQYDDPDYYTEAGIFLFYPPECNGTYEFYTRAEDEANNREPAPAYADCTVICGPAEPEIDIPVLSHDFGMLSIGAERQWLLRINNHGTGNLLISSIYSNNLDTFYLSDTNRSIAPGDWLDFPVVFCPWTVGVTDTTIMIYSNDDNLPITQVAVSGTGLGPLGPTLFLKAPARVIGDGQELEASIGIAGVFEDVEADLYIAAMLPTGELCYFPDWTTNPTGISVSLPAGLNTPPLPFLRFEYNEGELPKGEYKLFAALVEPGTRYNFMTEVAEIRWVLF